jgi:hypothetical protein
VAEPKTSASSVAELKTSASRLETSSGEEDGGSVASLMQQLSLASHSEEPLTLLVSGDGSFGSGFIGRYRGVFADHSEDFPLILECEVNPDSIPPEERRARMLVHDSECFDPERYLLDAVHGQEDPMFETMMVFEPHWESARLRRKARRRTLKKEGISEAEMKCQLDECWFDGWNEQEERLLVSLRREAPLVECGSIDEQRALGEAASLVLSVAYDERFTQGDPGGESAWTICVLDGCLGWQAPCDTPSDVIRSFAEKCASYVYLRRWDIIATCLSDACVVFSLGRRAILRCALRACHVLERHEHKRLLARV